MIKLIELLSAPILDIEAIRYQIQDDPLNYSSYLTVRDLLDTRFIQSTGDLTVDLSELIDELDDVNSNCSDRYFGDLYLAEMIGALPMPR